MDQDTFLEILFNDLGFDRKNQEAFMSRVLKREVKFFNGDLVVGEKSLLITMLKQLKAERYPPIG